MFASTLNKKVALEIEPTNARHGIKSPQMQRFDERVTELFPSSRQTIAFCNRAMIRHVGFLGRDTKPAHLFCSRSRSVSMFEDDIFFSSWS